MIPLLLDSSPYKHRKGSRLGGGLTGAVNEIIPADKLLARAREIGEGHDLASLRADHREAADAVVGTDEDFHEALCFISFWCEAIPAARARPESVITFHRIE